MYEPRELTCKDCRRVFISKHSAQVRCNECQKIHLKVLQKKYYRKVVAPKNKKPARDPNECKKKGSCYYSTVSGGTSICDYMGITGNRRPCPVEGCTEYKRKGRKKVTNEN